jgi:Domain of unknown function (DUF4384)
MIFKAPAVFASDETCSAKQKICFQWSFVANVQKEKKQLPVNLNEKTVLESGDQLHASFILKKPCFLYFIHSGSNDSLSLLYPHVLPQKSPSGNMPVTYHVPGDSQCFVLDKNTGEETFYLLAASMRLRELETLLLDYSNSNTTTKKALGQKITKKIETFRKKTGNLTASAERPVKIGGTVRGGIHQDNQDNKPSHNTFDSLMVSANDFYIKVITIDHK